METPDHGASHLSRTPSEVLGRWTPAMVVFMVAVFSLLRNDVSSIEVTKYVAYLFVGVVCPGLLVSRALIGARARLVDDLVVGAVCGLALQIAAWQVLRLFSLDVLLPWWWLGILAIWAVVPRLRRTWWPRFGTVTARGWSWSMAAVATVATIGVDLGWFRRNPIPPDGGVAHVDAWWHLAIVRELLRPGPPEIAQVAGEPLTYHATAHAHMAISSVTARVDPDVVLLRLWILPLAVLAVLLTAVVAEEVSGRRWSGPLAAVMAFVLLGGGYVWLGLDPLTTTPLRPASPSQIIVLPLGLAAGWGFVRAVRGGLDRRGWAWLALIVFAGSAAKPTLILTMLGGTALAAFVLAIRERAIPKGPAAAVVGLVALQVVNSPGRLEDRGSAITLLGSLKSLRVYQESTLDTTYRAVNDGFLLDSLSSGGALIAGAGTLVWFGVAHIFHLVGVAGFFRRDFRSDPANWWLVGVVLTGIAVFFTLDHSAFSQAYFLHTAFPFGVVLAAHLISVSFDGIDNRVGIIGTGLAVGSFTTLVSRSVQRALDVDDGLGSLHRVAVPLAVIGVVCVGARIALRTRSGLQRIGSHGGAAVALAVILGLAIPTALQFVPSQVVEWAMEPEQSFDVNDRGYLSADEQAAAKWLDANSDESDVIVSNTQCRELTTDRKTCNAVGFWVSGIAGRRVVIEGWGYTAPAHAAHGDDGLHRNRTDPGWPERYELSIAAIEDPSAEVIARLAADYGADWIFASRRAGPVSEKLDTLATPAFDNGAVAIFRLDASG